MGPVFSGVAPAGAAENDVVAAFSLARQLLTKSRRFPENLLTGREGQSPRRRRRPPLLQQLMTPAKEEKVLTYR
ncbi:hypothetical protein JOB18_000148 [Solea senegalensis]|uniref:Uncharacterized protein n=1 Tax=Solea senegalensis TaxID=28829 RepID=A0AAV6RFK4_SOLSE|nr:hypothetical protein JOB18_000148 [Solea senegalensis]